MTQTSQDTIALGIISLPDTKVRGEHSVFDWQHRLDVEIIEERIKEADLLRIASGNATAEYVAAARALEASGATAITSNCGLTGIYQSDVQRAVSVPSVMTAMSLLPLLYETRGGPILVLAYDDNMLAKQYVTLFGCLAPEMATISEIIPVVGASGFEWLEGDGDSLDADASSAADTLRIRALEPASRIGASCILVECTATLPTLESVKHETSIPIYDLRHAIEATVIPR